MIEQVQNVIDCMLQIVTDMINNDTTHILPIFFAAGLVSLGIDVVIAFNRDEGYEVKEMKQ